MITRGVYSYCRRPLVVVLCIGAALLASGCMWGMVKDANTGAPISGATVTYTDSTGATASTTTDAGGQYSFDQAGRPAPGPVNVRASAPGYEPVTIQVEYDGNPSGFGEVHYLTPVGSATPSYHNATWGFSIEFPYDWMVIEGEEQEEGTAVVGMAPPDGANDEYTEFCLVMAVELPGMTLDTFFQLMLAGIEEDPSGVQQLETGDANLNGQDAKWLLIALTDPDFNMDVNELIYLLVADQRGYMIMCVSDAAQFPSHRGEFEGIAESFQLD